MILELLVHRQIRYVLCDVSIGQVEVESGRQEKGLVVDVCAHIAQQERIAAEMKLLSVQQYRRHHIPDMHERYQCKVVLLKQFTKILILECQYIVVAVVIVIVVEEKRNSGSDSGSGSGSSV